MFDQFVDWVSGKWWSYPVVFLVSMLDAKGTPTVTERAWILPPMSQIGPIADAQRDQIRKAGAASYGHYEKAEDPESAYEKLKAGAGGASPGEAGGGGSVRHPGPSPCHGGRARRCPFGHGHLPSGAEWRGLPSRARDRRAHASGEPRDRTPAAEGVGKPWSGRGARR